jgi:hydrogenase maturation protein HypF
MLPYTPLHASLLKQYAESTGRGPTVLVMTSGNLSDEVVVEQLRPRADRILTHNRAIETRCDDSVPHVTAAGPQFLRRFYGYTPEPLSCL